MEDLFSYNYFQNNDMNEYRRLLRMDEACFNFLLEALRPDITYQDTNCRRAVTPEQRLSTLFSV